MMLDAKKLSEAIRMKKKKMLEADPELIGTSPTPDMNAQDIYDLDQKGKIEGTLDVPHKIDADDTMMGQSEEEAMNVGVSGDEMKRMGRLRKYIDSMSL